MEENANSKKILQSGLLAILIYCVIIVFYHLFGYELIADDASVVERLRPSLQEELADIERSYNGWSSRVLINPIIWILYHFDIKVWAIINVLITVGCFVCVNYLSGNKNGNKNRCFVLLLLMLLIPFGITTETGWVVTSVSYVWPLFFGLLSCVNIRKYYDDEEINKLTYIPLCLCTLFASNKEELSIILTIVFAFVCLISYFDKKIKLCFLIQMLIASASVMFHFLHSGNMERNVNSTLFVDMSFFEKVITGIVSTLNHLFYGVDYFFTCFCILLFFLTMQLNKGIVCKTISAVPALICVLSITMVFFASRDSFDSKILYKYVNPECVITEIGNMYVYNNIIPTLIVALLGAVCVVITIYNLVEKFNIKILLIVIICAGFAGRVVIGFSGNGYGSFERTYLFFYYIMEICLWYIISHIDNKEKKLFNKKLKCLIFGMAIVNIFFVSLEIGIW